MSSIVFGTSFQPILPWDRDPREIKRFQKLVAGFLIASVLLGILIPFLPVDKPDRTKPTSIPPRLVKMVLEQKKIIKPPPPVVVKEEPEPEPEEVKKPEEKKVEENPVPIKTAKEVAKKHVAVFDVFADIRDESESQQNHKDRSLSNDEGKAAQVTRALIGKQATQGSGGIQVANASRSSGIGTLKGQNEIEVKSDIGDAVANTKRQLKSGNFKRSSENIQLAFDKAKTAIFAIYNRALRKNPQLQGIVVFNLTIEPNGSVSGCSVVSSELNDAELEKRIVARIKRIQFGEAEVATWSGNYPISFFPSN